MAQESGVIGGFLDKAFGPSLLQEKRRLDIQKARREEDESLLQSGLSKALDSSSIGFQPGQPGGGVLAAGMGGGIQGPPMGAGSFVTDRPSAGRDLDVGPQRPFMQDVTAGPPLAGAPKGTLLEQDFSPEEFKRLTDRGMIRETEPGKSGVFTLNPENAAVRKAMASRRSEVRDAERQALVSDVSASMGEAFIAGDEKRASELSLRLAVLNGKSPDEGKLIAARSAGALKNAPIETRTQYATLQAVQKRLEGGAVPGGASIGPNSIQVHFLDNVGKTGDAEKSLLSAAKIVNQELRTGLTNYLKADEEQRSVIRSNTKTRLTGIVGSLSDQDASMLASSFAIPFDPRDPIGSREAMIQRLMDEGFIEPEEAPGFIKRISDSVSKIWKTNPEQVPASELKRFRTTQVPGRQG